ncbi:MAG: hypothetical protein QM220_09345 [Atribacterota bacterium]|nr:hypothetical protein [Atribacterota bacterium]MDD4765179.1 hypothetical protein [Atribacterota bacterium]MDI9597715.1 hypothetical protein [Atribacterota bacterium]
MPKNEKKLNRSNEQATLRYMVYFLIFLLYLIPIIIVIMHGFSDYFQLFRRVTALTGISSLFIAIILSSLVRQSKKLFGTVYIKIHHFFSISGLILITLHPIIMAIDFGTTSIFALSFSSWDAFLTNGGRPALYLAYIATIAAVLRKSITKYWRYFHSIIYFAFIFGAIHGLRMGSNLSSPILYGLFIIMIAAVIANFFYKRYLNT